jgi:hypothetical protein
LLSHVDAWWHYREDSKRQVAELAAQNAAEAAAADEAEDTAKAESSPR